MAYRGLCYTAAWRETSMILAGQTPAYIEKEQSVCPTLDGGGLKKQQLNTSRTLCTSESVRFFIGFLTTNTFGCSSVSPSYGIKYRTKVTALAIREVREPAGSDGF
jgi:hypothetical protein